MKFKQKFILFHLVAVFMINLAASQTILDAAEEGDSKQDTNFTLSDIQLKNGEAAVWYLFHAGWAVKTASALLIFDYLVQMQNPEQLSLFNGSVNPNEIKDQNVYVFISHGHGDHFDEKILEWKKIIPHITYVFGWQASETQPYHIFGKDRSSKSIGKLSVKNIFHDFDGIPESAFLIEVDGLTIYYSGDHGNSPGALNPVYKNNIDYISQQAGELDLVFLSIFGSPTYEGELYAVDKFKPRVMLPMHYGGREQDAEGFVAFARTKIPKTEFWYPLNSGDGFFYKKGKIFPLKGSW
jgi:L-ascorbate metabolism protein UlaG (beta-lactamase superfamily)